MKENDGEDVKGGVVIGYEPNDPLERGDERTAAGERRVGERRGSCETSLRFRVAILEPYSRFPLTIYDIRLFYVCPETGSRVISPISHMGNRLLYTRSKAGER